MQPQQLEFGNLPIATPSLRMLRETPAARIIEQGPKAVSLLELVSAVVGNSDVALHVLAQFPTANALARAPQADLLAIGGMGPGRVAALQAALELGLRVSLGADPDRKQIRSPADAANLLMAAVGVTEQEQMWTVMLDTRNRVLGTVMVYQGSVHTAVVRTGELFREPIRRNATAIIVAHSHPSGDPSPSPEDVSTNKAIVAAGKSLDVDVLDHIILGCGQRFVSLKERGLGFD